MSVLTGRGGVPRVLNETVTTTGREYTFPFTCLWLMLRTASAPIRMYFREVDFDASVNYVEIAVGATYWEGPAEVSSIWLQSVGVGSATVEMIGFQRRG